MGSFVIEGGHRLKGEVIPQGAKNEALQIICAVLLTDERVVIENIPQIIDVLRLIDILKQLGVKVVQVDQHTFAFDASGASPDYLFSEGFKKKLQDYAARSC